MTRPLAAPLPLSPAPAPTPGQPCGLCGEAPWDGTDPDALPCCAACRGLCSGAVWALARLLRQRANEEAA